DGSTQLWLRALSALAMQPLAGTDSARTPFWSPDSRFLAFVADNKLKKVDTATGAVTTLCDVPGTQPTGGTWSTDGTILVANNVGPILRVPASGGQPVAATTLD